MKKASARDQKILRTLAQLYPETGSELNFSSPYELITSVILSAQCTDKKVNEVTPQLFERYPSFAALSTAPVSAIEKIIRPINYYRTKSRNLVAMAHAVCERHNGKIPRTHELLMELPGVGRKTANVVLGELKIIPCIPVDTHVFRVSKRLGIATGETPDSVEEALKERFDESCWYNLHHWLIYHGRRVCKAQRPLCGECALQKECPSRQSG